MLTEMYSNLSRPDIGVLIQMENWRRQGREWVSSRMVKAWLQEHCKYRYGLGTLIAECGGRALFFQRGRRSATEWSLSAAGVKRAQDLLYRGGLRKNRDHIEKREEQRFQSIT